MEYFCCHCHMTSDPHTPLHYWQLMAVSCFPWPAASQTIDSWWQLAVLTDSCDSVLLSQSCIQSCYYYWHLLAICWSHWQQRTLSHQLQPMTDSFFHWQMTRKEPVNPAYWQSNSLPAYSWSCHCWHPLTSADSCSPELLPFRPGPARCQSLPGAQGERGAATTENIEDSEENTAEDAENTDVADIIASEEEQTWRKQTGKFKLRVAHKKAHKKR